MSKIIFCRRNKTIMKLVLLRQCCTQKTAESRSPGKLYRCFQHIVLSLSTPCPASTQAQLDFGLMLISPSMSGGSTFATHFLTGAPSAACCLSVCRTLPILFRCECQNNQIGRHWHEHSEVEFVSQISPFATLHPGKQILKMSLLSGVFFAMQGHSLTGENKHWYLGVKMMTRLY